MANISNYLEEQLLDHSLGTSSFTMPSTVYVGIASDSATDTELEAGTLSNEIVGYNGDRKSVTFSASSQDGGKATTSNVDPVEFEEMPVGTVAYAFIADAASAGNILWWLPLDENKSTNNGDTFRIPAGGLSLDLD